MKLNRFLICLVVCVLVSVFCLAQPGNSIRAENDQCYDSSDCNSVDYTNYYCDTDEEICKCLDPPTYLKELQNYTCLLTGIKYGEACEYDEQCSTTSIFGYSCTDYDSNYGYTCPVSMCSYTNNEYTCASSDCVDNICKCKPGFYYDGAQCQLAKVKYNDDCIYDEQCMTQSDWYGVTDVSRICSEDGKCSCYKNSWYRPKMDFCIKMWGNYGNYQNQAGPLSGIIVGCIIGVIILAGVIGYFAYGYFEVKPKKDELLRSQSSLA